jgi:hypothetical protein
MKECLEHILKTPENLLCVRRNVEHISTGR